MIRNFVSFKSSLPDDSVEFEREIAMPDGCALMELICDAFQRAGYAVSEVELHSCYGWCFDASDESGRFWLMVQFPDPWLLMIQDYRPFWRRLFKSNADFERFVEKSRSILQGLPEISEFVWYSEREWRDQNQRNIPPDQ
jgi:hypothetical protein